MGLFAKNAFYSLNIFEILEVLRENYFTTSNTYYVKRKFSKQTQDFEKRVLDCRQIANLLLLESWKVFKPHSSMRQIWKVFYAADAGVDVAVDWMAPYAFWCKVKLQRNIYFDIVFFA
jgi:hypothetical protein